jgi:hypothetical protein
MVRCLFIMGISIAVRQRRQDHFPALNGIELRVKLFLVHQYP